MKRYQFSCIEEGVLNPAFAGYRYFRVEVYDNESDSSYAIYEASFLIPEEFYEPLRDIFDMKESDLMPRIVWECKKEDE